MTDPRTAAGRAHEDYCRTFLGDDAAKEILAIEAEARAAALDEARAAVEDHMPGIGSWIDHSTWLECSCGWDGSTAKESWTEHLALAIDALRERA